MKEDQRRGKRATSQALVGEPLLLLPLLLPIALLGAMRDGVRAATIVPPPSLGDLALQCDAVVLVTVLDSWPRPWGEAIFTETEARVDEVVSGPLLPGDHVVVRTPGGTAGERSWIVPGSPQLERGARYLLPLVRKEGEGVWLTAVLALGVLVESRAEDGAWLLGPISDLEGLEPLERPDGVAPEPIGVYREDALLFHLREVILGASAWTSSVVVATQQPAAGALGGGGARPAGCAYLESGGNPFRWRAFDSSGEATVLLDRTGDVSLADGGAGEAVEATTIWHGVPDTGLNLIVGGSTDLAINCQDGAQANTIVFNDPCGDIADLDGCAGVLAYGGPLANGTHTFDGTRWNTATGWIVVVNGGAGCLGSRNYSIMLAHELGHGLGFGHVNDGGALMFANCCNAVNTTDTVCAQYTYPPASTTNRRPIANAGPDVSLTLAGDTLELSGSADDDGLPSPSALRVSWRLVAGPGKVRFSSPSSLKTRVTFEASGLHVLSLTVDDGQLIAADSLTADVQILAGSVSETSFRQGVGGYSGTVDTFLLQSASKANESRALSLNVDSDEPTGSGQSAQALLRFDAIFGAGGSLVPPGSKILAAILELETTNAGDGADFRRMKADWDDTDTWASFGGNGLQPGTEAVSAIEASVTPLVGPTSIDLTSSLQAWSEDPCSNLGWGLFPRGNDGWDFDSSEGASPPILRVRYARTAGAALLGAGSEWLIFKGTEDPPASWRQESFTPDARWVAGRAGIGYGDGDDVTVLDDMRGAYATVFLRHAFELTAADLVDLSLTVVVDDGVVVHVNGREVGRSGVAAGAVTRSTLASAAHEAEAVLFTVKSSFLHAGQNVLAVSVHNASLDSSDLSFDAILTRATAATSVVCGARFLRGDATGNGILELTDAVRTLGFLFSGGPAPACPDAADADDDGSVGLTDAVRVLNHLFLGAAALPPPGAACGVDPTPDGLGECQGSSCEG